MKFNKEGNLLVVNTANNGFKVLANADGLRSLRAIEARSYNASRAPSEMKVVYLARSYDPVPPLLYFHIGLCWGLNFLMDQVSSSSVVANNNLVISKVEHSESSPARPTPIHVCHIKTQVRFYFNN